MLLPLLVGRRGWQRIKLPTPDLIQCLVLGMLGVAASNYFYYVAIQRTSVAIAIIVQYTAPVWVLLYVVARGQQKLSLQKVAAVGVAIAGIALDHRHRRREIRIALCVSTPTASSPRCWHRSHSPSTTSADTAFSPATTAGASWSGR